MILHCVIKQVDLNYKALTFPFVEDSLCIFEHSDYSSQSEIQKTFFSLADS